MHRRRTVLGVALIALIALPAAAGTGAAAGMAGEREPAALSLPDRIGVPWPWNPTVDEAPVQPAALIFSGSRFPLSTIDDDTNVVITAGNDSYRMLPLSGPAVPGADVLLAPDGTKVAFRATGSSPGIGVLDLRTGRRALLPSPNPDTSPNPGIEYLDLLAWSPDGSRVAVSRSDEDREELGLMDTASGRYQRLAEVTVNNGSPHGVAFTPDGGRLTYQDQLTVVTVRLDGTRESSFPVGADTYLAGKGAWRPDGTALALSVKTGTGWNLRLVDPADGDALPDQGHPTVKGVTTLRLLGWQHRTVPIAVAYLPEADVPDRLGPKDVTFERYVRSLEILRLPAGADPEVLLSTPAQVLSLDVADQVITAGAVRAGEGAPLLPVRPWWAAAGTLLACTAALVAVRAATRRARRRSGIRTSDHLAAQNTRSP